MIISMEENTANFKYLGNRGLCFSLCMNVTKYPNLCEMSHTELYGLATWNANSVLGVDLRGGNN